MIKQVIKSVLFLVIVLLNFSCNNDDYTKQLEKWKTDNDSYFNNMKDSTNFQQYDLPVENGGGMYYYRIIKQGDITASSPALQDVVKVNYKGMLINGTVFDGTYSGANPLTDSAAKPVEFTVNKLIPGWVENLTQMKPGEIRTIVLPYYLGYGMYGAGSAILPYTTLRFDMHLISISKTIVE
jgi:FKBP-type peptidyl-prolyl cis-trans isomerase